MRLLFKGGTVVTGKGPRRADILVEGEKILDVCRDIPAIGAQVVDVTGMLLFPGFIDAHTHFDLDVCNTTTADDFASGSRAALRGGTTTIIDFACPNKGETLHDGLRLWHQKADGKCACDYGFHMTIADWNDTIESEIDDMYAEGISSFKMYMTYPAMMIGDKLMYKALKKLKEKGGICGVHCENAGVIDALIEEKKAAGMQGSVGCHPRTRPDFLEAEAVGRLLHIAEAVDIPVVIVHTTNAAALREIEAARRRGQKVYVETCPQYLILDDSVYDNEDWLQAAKYVCAPPIRKAADRKALWQGIRRGEVQTVSTDHCSFTTAQKLAGRDDFTAIPGGLPGVETRGEVVYSAGVATRKISLATMCRVLAEMETAGFLVDRKALAQYGETLQGVMDETEQAVYAAAGETFNINSPKQLGAILFEKLGLPHGKKTKTGWSTNADVLEKLRYDAPIVADVLRYRQYAKLKSTYVDGLLKVIDPDGRVRTSFQMTVTATGRLSSTEPNLQNIPTRTELGSQLRRMFTAPEGCVLVDADYSQIELRLLAHIAGDTEMQAAFRSGEDFHTVTASRVFHVPPEEVTPEMRRRAKAVNFGIVYGISAFALAQDIGVTVAEAKAYMERYFETYQGVRQYMTNVVAKAEQDGYVQTLMHRRRALPELKSSNFNLREFGKRVALNMPVQGSAADIMKLAMVRVHDRLKREGLRARLLMQVHDELIAECPVEEQAQVKRILTEEMEHAAALSVPLTVDAHCGKNWLEAKG